jgi:hypothetical protein
MSLYDFTIEMCTDMFIIVIIFPIRNYYLMFGLISETCLAVFLAYCPGISAVLGMYGLRLVTLPTVRTHTL